MSVIEKPAEMSIIDISGDTKVKWDPANPAEVENARRTFDELKGKGFIPFAGGGKTPTRQLNEFDPSAKTMVMTPPMVAG